MFWSRAGRPSSPARPAGHASRCRPRRRRRRPDPEPVDDLGEDSADCEGCGKAIVGEAFTTKDDVELCRGCYEAVPVEGVPVALVRTLPERCCSVKRCLKKFTPTHEAQTLCPKCRGFRVDERATDRPKSDSWWLNTTSRDDFQQRAAGQEDRMKGSKEKFAVPNRILGEKA